MNMSFVITANLLIVLGLFLVLPILIGVYVYRDASSRGMNAPLWTLIAILSPALIGFIVYLIARNDQTSLECPSCRASVKESYAVCPSCGTQLKGRCQKCDYPLNSGWDHCPQCGETVPADARPPLTVKRRETGLGKILIAVIVIPILIVIVLFMGLMSFSTSTMSVGSGTGSRIEDYSTRSEIFNWLNASRDSGDGIYVLAYEREPDTKDGANYASYIILYNGVEQDADVSSGPEMKWLFDKVLRVEFTNTAGYNPDHYVILQTEYTTKDDMDLEIYVDGEKVPYSRTESATPLSLNMGY